VVGRSFRSFERIGTGFRTHVSANQSARIHRFEQILFSKRDEIFITTVHR